MPISPLEERFTALADRPANSEQWVLRNQVLKLVRAIGRALGVIRHLVEGLQDVANRLRHQRMAMTAMEFELDRHRAHRAASQERLERWELAHCWRVRATARFGMRPGRVAEGGRRCFMT